ncbi:MAG: hypothetical protein AAF805_11735 [Planctomycetota bacterium]
MKLRIAAVAAALAVVASTGCTAVNSCGPCGDLPCHVATSRFAPRATNLEGRCVRGPGLLGKLGVGCQPAGCGEMCGDGCGMGSCGLGGGMFAGCGSCGPGGCGSNALNGAIGKLLDCNGCNGCGDQHYNFTPGPPVGQVAYPYYTVRGPRDFLAPNPPSIGPR